ncbi:MAG TPA: ATP-binding protein [Anaerolineales bacterium]|nr:ATP-binding protein [Anaerolineales bacterium]
MTAKKNTPPENQVAEIASMRLPESALYRYCDPQSLKFENTDMLPDLEVVIGQPRAIRALDLGSEVTGQGYNTFVLGLPGSGRTTLSREYLDRKAAEMPPPEDWCYVNNFDNPRQPKAIALPAGQGQQFTKHLMELISTCEREIARTFVSKEYTQERDRLVNEVKKKQEAEFIRLQEHVEKFSFLIVRTTFGFVLVPAVEGKPLKPEDVEKLSLEQRSKLEQVQARLSQEVEKSIKHIRELENRASERLSELDEQTVLFLIAPILEAIKSSYTNLPSVLAHLEAIKKDIIDHVDQFRAKESGDASEGLAGMLAKREWIRRYETNLLIDNSSLKGAPVVVESHPSYPNLLGRIEHEVVMGGSRTDFTMIHPGALHRANGGYLVIPARDLLINAYAWEGLKHTLRDGKIRIIELGQQLGLLSTVTLEPEPIPLNLKVVLVGTPMLYYLLRAYDEDFAKLFKVRAEFATTMDRNPDTEHEYGLFVKSVVVDNKLPVFDRTAIARIIEYSSRLAEDQAKLSTRFGKIADLVREAAYWARKVDGNAGQVEEDRDVLVTATAVQRAIDESIYRSNLIEERIQEMIAEGTLLISVSGEVIGQVNALSVALLGDYAFGRPTRVTAVAFPGKGGVVDIERQAKLGGPIHTKGILILSGLLGGRYGQGRPLSLSASLTFEQSYDEVEGDSASAAEFFALLSAIAEVPLRQDRAITGSINQRGEIQAIGGVNEKIEGYFSTCKALGLTGEQGVIIPAGNVKHLMLSADVLKAVQANQFHVWSIQTIEDGLRLLTDIEAGELQGDGSYPEGTFNHAVVKRLAEFTKLLEPAKKEAEEKHPKNDG